MARLRYLHMKLMRNPCPSGCQAGASWSQDGKSYNQKGRFSERVSYRKLNYLCALCLSPFTWQESSVCNRADLQRMSPLVSALHLQLTAFALGTVGWILCTISMGMVEWRVWHVDNTTIISSGVAWVGIWKVCFISYLHVSPGYREQFCHKFSGYESFIPHEIYAAQGLLLIAMFVGLLGLAATIFGLRNVYMGITHKTLITPFFLVGGFFYVFAGLCALIPVSWNFYSVTHNRSIAFPPSYYMPSSPVAQEAGAAIPVGIVAVILLLLSGTFSLSYRFPGAANTNTKS